MVKDIAPSDTIQVTGGTFEVEVLLSLERSSMKGPSSSLKWSRTEWGCLGSSPRLQGQGDRREWPRSGSLVSRQESWGPVT